MAEKRKHRLKAAEFKALLEDLRKWLRLQPEVTKKSLSEMIGSLVAHVNALEDDKLELTRELREVRQQDMFAKQAAARDAPPTKPEPVEYVSPEERDRIRDSLRRKVSGDR